jgi:hypothetical protein
MTPTYLRLADAANKCAARLRYIAAHCAHAYNDETPSDVEEVRSDAEKLGTLMETVLSLMAEIAGSDPDECENCLVDAISDAFQDAEKRAAARVEETYEDPNAEHRLTASQLGVGRYA